MQVSLNHPIVHSKNQKLSAQWYQDIFGFKYLKDWGPFSVVKINEELTFDFMTTNSEFTWQHYAFKVSDDDFDRILNLKSKGIEFDSEPEAVLSSSFDNKINKITMEERLFSRSRRTYIRDSDC